MIAQAAILSALVVQGWAEKPDDETMRRIHAGHRANVAAFRFGDFDFEVVHEGSPSSPDGKPVKAAGRYAFDGRNAIYELRYDQPAEDAAPMSFQSRRLLRDERSTAMDLIAPDFEAKSVFHAAQVLDDPEASQFMSFFLFPIGLGFVDAIEPRLCRDLAMAMRGELRVVDMTIDRSSGGEGKARFTLEHPTFKIAIRYVVDLDRGALPVESWDLGPDGRERSSTRLEGLVHVDGAGWMPTRQVSQDLATGETTTVAVTRRDVARKPPPSTFRLAFDPPRDILDRPRSMEYEACASFSLIERPGQEAGARRVTIPD